MSYHFGVELDSKHVPSYADEGRARRALQEAVLPARPQMALLHLRPRLRCAGLGRGAAQDRGRGLGD